VIELAGETFSASAECGSPPCQQNEAQLGWQGLAKPGGPASLLGGFLLLRFGGGDAVEEVVDDLPHRLRGGAAEALGGFAQTDHCAAGMARVLRASSLMSWAVSPALCGERDGRQISPVAALWSPTESAIWLTVLFDIQRVESTSRKAVSTPPTDECIAVMIASISIVDVAVWPARFLTSEATTAKPPAGLARACSFDGRVQGEQVGLLCDGADHLDHLCDLAATLLARAHPSRPRRGG